MDFLTQGFNPFARSIGDAFRPGGVVNPNDPMKKAGMMGAAQALLEASGPQRTPMSLGQIAARGLGGYQQGRDAEQQRMYSREQMDLANEKLEMVRASKELGLQQQQDEAKTAKEQRAEANAAIDQMVTDGKLDPAKARILKLQKLDKLMPVLFPDQDAAKPFSPIGKLQADRARAEANGAPPELLAQYDAAIQKATTQSSGQNIEINMPGGEASGGGGYKVLDIDSKKGYVTRQNLETGEVEMLPIKGGPAALSAKDAAEKRGKQDAMTGKYANVVLDSIDSAMARIDENPEGTTGIGGMLLRNLPTSDADRLQRDVKTVVSNVGFGRLQEMREASPTGGALGAVSQMELEQLNAALGDLDTAQHVDDIKRNLGRVKAIYQGIASKVDYSAPDAHMLPAGLAQGNKSGGGQPSGELPALPSGFEMIQ